MYITSSVYLVYIQNGHIPKRPQTKKATKWYQNGQIYQANEKLIGNLIKFL